MIFFTDRVVIVKFLLILSKNDKNIWSNEFFFVTLQVEIYCDNWVMKRFKILCVLLLTVFFASVVADFVIDFVSGARMGYTMGEYIVDNELESREHLYVDVLTEVNKKVLTPNALNKLSGDSVVILRNNVSVVEYATSFSGNSEKHNVWYEVLNWINFLIIAIFVYLTVVFVKIMRLFIRSQVFEHKIISLLNHLGVAFLGLAIVTTAWNFGRTYLVGHLIEVEGLIVSYRHCIEWNNLLLGLVILVITEILRQATTIKEEQDLTI